MRRISPRLLALAAAASLGVAGCGGGGDDGGSGSTSSGAASGGTATAYFTSFPDYLDPALSYTVEGWSALWVTYTPLLTYKHVASEEGAKVVPGLAEALPEVSDDGKTYELKLRKGLTYSDGSAVKASDFEHSVKRVLNLESGASFYFQNIVGADEYLKAGKAKGDISGITTDDATGAIKIELKDADGQFPNVLAMTFGAPTPSGTPFSNQTKSPPPGVGAFKITSVNGTRGFTLTKNTRFKGIDESVPTAKLDSLKVTVVKDSRRQGQDIIDNKVDYLIDPPVSEQLREIKAKLKDRFREYTTLSTYYLFLNSKVPPFDKKEVRQAVNFGLNKPALARQFDGLLAPECNFLPPNIPGYEPTDPCPYGDPNGEPDLAKARQLLEQAGAKGAKVTVWGNDEPATRDVTLTLADQLKDIGLDAKPKIVDGAVYFQTIGNQKTKAQAGFANWFSDFPHPGNFMFMLNSKSIQQTNNQNYGNIDDPELDKLIDEAGRNADLSAVTDLYAQADERVIDEAYNAPYGNRKLTLVTSDKLAFDQIVWHPFYYADYSSFALKG